MLFKRKFEDLYKKFLEECVVPGQLSFNMIAGIIIELSDYKKPLKALATIMNHSSSQLKIMPFDSSHLKHIELCLRNANIGIITTLDKCLLISASQTTQEQYKKILNLMKESIENTKKHMRSIRHQELKDLDEDEKKRMDKIVQKELDDYNKLFEKKIKEFEIQYKL